MNSIEKIGPLESPSRGLVIDLSSEEEDDKNKELASKGLGTTQGRAQQDSKPEADSSPDNRAIKRAKSDLDEEKVQEMRTSSLESPSSSASAQCRLCLEPLSTVQLSCPNNHTCCATCAARYVSATWYPRELPSPPLPLIACFECPEAYDHLELIRIIAHDPEALKCFDERRLEYKRQDTIQEISQKLGQQSRDDKEKLLLEAKLMGFMRDPRMCPKCKYGPVDKRQATECDDLGRHQGETLGAGAAAYNNTCPSCGFFASNYREWNTWDGELRYVDRGGAVAAHVHATRPPNPIHRTVPSSGTGAAGVTGAMAAYRLSATHSAFYDSVDEQVRERTRCPLGEARRVRIQLVGGRGRAAAGRHLVAPFEQECAQVACGEMTAPGPAQLALVAAICAQIEQRRRPSMEHLIEDDLSMLVLPTPPAMRRHDSGSDYMMDERPQRRTEPPFSFREPDPHVTFSSSAYFVPEGSFEWPMPPAAPILRPVSTMNQPPKPTPPVPPPPPPASEAREQEPRTRTLVDPSRVLRMPHSPSFDMLALPDNLWEVFDVGDNSSAGRPPA